jgi:molybdopterin-guanine dinucleotide biosynthesis protein MobB
MREPSWNSLRTSIHSTAACFSVANGDSPISRGSIPRFKGTALSSSILRENHVFKNETAISSPNIMVNNMRAFAVSGYSGTGKTALVEHIIQALREQGYVVVTAKSSMHDAKEVEGTDTWRHLQAGAKMAVYLGPHSTIIRYRQGKGLQELFAGTEADFLIIEGLKESEIPKVWCIGNTELDASKIPQATKAIVSWGQRETGVEDGMPFLRSDEIEKIVEIIKQEAMELSQLDSLLLQVEGAAQMPFIVT